MQGTGAGDRRQAVPILGLPDVLTLARLPLAVLFYFLGAFPWLRIGVVVVAALSDVLDGFWARRSGGSRAGPLLDPVFDKLFFLIAFSSLLLEGRITLLAAAAVMLRDIFAFLGLIAVTLSGRPRAIPARIGGKLVTGAQIITLILGIVGSSLVPVLAWVTAAISVYAIVDYVKTDNQIRSPAGRDR